MKTVTNLVSLSLNYLSITNPGIGFQYFGSDPTTPVFQISGSGVQVGSITYSVVNVNAPYSISSGNAIINILTPGIVSLPSCAANSGKAYIINNISGGTVTLTSTGGDTIDGVASIPLSPGDHINITSPGTTTWTS